ncbi:MULTISPECIES: hypothetical protein [unclassified Mesorhizobium]|uniref:hypothetical protein n=1 Tax=unclassified Mesorhizobium TaxID=325217 RepID=UPI001201FA00|nr:MULTISPECIES: hypothetical protein [unclassified Mesorhizobium]TIM85234.1 MAG: hypothetical protein E5Y50_19445 [Mesorhizobium sp.]
MTNHLERSHGIVLSGPMISRVANANVYSGQRAARLNLPQLRTLPMSIPATTRSIINVGEVERHWHEVRKSNANTAD